MFAILVGAFLTSCGEAGIESNVSKVIEQEFTVTNSSEFASLPNVGGGVQAYFAFDPSSEEFAEYTGDIDQYFLNKVELEVISIETDGGVPISLDYFGFGVKESETDALVSQNVWATGNKNLDSQKEIGLYNALTNGGALKVSTSPIVLYDASNRNNDFFFSDGNPPSQVVDFINAIKSGNTRYIWSGIWGGNIGGNSTLDFTVRVKVRIDLTARVQLD